MNDFSAHFWYDKKGYGYLDINDADNINVSVLCRTGSIGTDGLLKKSIKPELWTGREPPVVTDEPGMVVDGFGWKYRLWDEAGNRTHYLIHPDGNKPGSLGCIVPIKYNNIWLFELLKFIHTRQKVMNVKIEAEA